MTATVSTTKNLNVGEVWYSPDTGNRWLIRAIAASADGNMAMDRITVDRIGGNGALYGNYVFVRASFWNLKEERHRNHD